jgi:hypothetical protein
MPAAADGVPLLLLPITFLLTPMHRAYKSVYRALRRTADWTGLTFEVVTVTAYFILLPFFVVSLLDLVLEFHLFKTVYAVFLVVLLVTMRGYQRFCITVFDGSVEVLKKLEAAGITYVRASVFLSVELPLTVTLALVVVALVG